MRPNLAFGPIDSLQQYLLYLSVVVLGVLLPLLAARWKKHRDDRALAARTVGSLQRELEHNRERVDLALQSLPPLVQLFEAEARRCEAGLSRLLDDPDAKLAPSPDADQRLGLTFAAVVGTAWESARLSHALPLLPEPLLQAYTRAYHLQALYGEDRRFVLQTAFETEGLAVPLRRPSIEQLEARLRAVNTARSVVRYQQGLLEAMREAYDKALAASGQRSAA